MWNEYQCPEFNVTVQCFGRLVLPWSNSETEGNFSQIECSSSSSSWNQVEKHLHLYYIMWGQDVPTRVSLTGRPWVQAAPTQFEQLVNDLLRHILWVHMTQNSHPNHHHSADDPPATDSLSLPRLWTVNQVCTQHTIDPSPTHFILPNICYPYQQLSRYGKGNQLHLWLCVCLHCKRKTASESVEIYSRQSIRKYRF